MLRFIFTLTGVALLSRLEIIKNEEDDAVVQEYDRDVRQRSKLHEIEDLIKSLDQSVILLDNDREVLFQNSEMEDLTRTLREHCRDQSLDVLQAEFLRLKDEA